MRTVFNELTLAHGFKQVDPVDHERMRHLHGMELLRTLNGPHCTMDLHMPTSSLPAKPEIFPACFSWIHPGTLLAMNCYPSDRARKIGTTVGSHRC
jgi:hypothetical protein